MAGRLILFKNSLRPIEGDSVAPDFAGQIRVDHMGMLLDGFPFGGSSVIHHAPIQLMIPFGPWVAELQARLYTGELLGTVDITEVEQQKGEADKLKVIRKMTLRETSISQMHHLWRGIETDITVNLMFDAIVFESNAKLAEFNHQDAAG